MANSYEEIFGIPTDVEDISVEHDYDYREIASQIESILMTYGVAVKVENMICGPTFTRYELKLGDGVRINEIRELVDDLRMRLTIHDIRIDAPIPGKTFIGLEIPHIHRKKVNLIETLKAEEFVEADSITAFIVGKDIEGNTIVSDLDTLHHLLIVGDEDSGKSTFIHSIITCIVSKAEPTDVRMIMFDPSFVELFAYNKLPHMLFPVVTDPLKAKDVFSWIRNEMTRRYGLFADHGVRNIKLYNERIISGAIPSGKEGFTKLPEIVVIINELADLMMSAPAETESFILQIVNLAHVAGIYLIAATRNVSGEYYSKQFLNDIPSRVVFRISDSTVCNTYDYMKEAEHLLGKGDMFFCPRGNRFGQLYRRRIQGAYVSKFDVDDIVEEITKINKKKAEC